MNQIDFFYPNVRVLGVPLRAFSTISGIVDVRRSLEFLRYKNSILTCELAASPTFRSLFVLRRRNSKRFLTFPANGSFFTSRHFFSMIDSAMLFHGK